MTTCNELIKEALKDRDFINNEASFRRASLDANYIGILPDVRLYIHPQYGEKPVGYYSYCRINGQIRRQFVSNL